MKNYLRVSIFLLMMLFCVSLNAQNNHWNYIHKVKKKETIFGIAKDYKVSMQELLDANPIMKQSGYELKKGDKILVPFAKDKDQIIDPLRNTNSSQPSQTNPSSQAKKTSNANANAIKVGVMLPLHNLDGDGLRMVEYYRGLLLAFNQLKSEGINTDVHAWNVAKDVDINVTLNDPNAANLDVIFGPLYTPQVKPLADFCKKHGIKLVIPFSIEGNDVKSNSNVFQVYQNDSILTSAAVLSFIERFQTTHHPIFINCNDGSSRVGSFTTTLKKQLSNAGIKYDLTNVNTSMDDFAKHFVSSRPNAIVINSEKSPQLNRVFQKLDSLKATHPGLAISIFGYNDWFMYQDYDLDQFYKYNVYIPTTYYYNKSSVSTEKLQALYKETYNAEMDKKYIPRLALTGYDHGQFFIRGLKQYGKSFKGTTEQSTYRPLQTPLRFKALPNGGFQNCNFQLIRFKADQTIEKLTY